MKKTIVHNILLLFKFKSNDKYSHLTTILSCDERKG